MGTKVSIASKGNGKGKIEIEYYSDEELERMFDNDYEHWKGRIIWKARY